MIAIDTLQQDNHKIAEHSKVLSVLIKNRELCDTQVLCDIFFNYVDAVKEHLDIEDRNIYQPMLVHSDADIKHTASQFMSGSIEIKRVISEYTKQWCRKDSLRIKNHDQFVADTEDIFELVWKRIIDESEHLYPVFKRAIQHKEVA
ncbi:MAG: hypothetical protein DSZ29_02565 [Aquificaceae bacterium]|nr:MAG: hypothetical protein DSZ29_02565 [Aquificaceae bacterium]